MGQVLGVQLTWVWQTTPKAIVSIAAMSTIGTTTRQTLVRPGISEAVFGDRNALRVV